MVASDIKIRSFRGSAIKTYIPSLAKIRSEVLQEFPYLVSPLHHEEDLQYLQNLSQSKDAIAVVIFDGAKIVGVAPGIPLEEEWSLVQKPLVDKELQPSHYYYFGVSALLKPYRGRGIAHHFFDIREQHVKNLKRFQKACFSIVQRPQTHHRRPADYIPLDVFWKKRGYVEHPHLSFEYGWVETSHEKPTPQSLVYWVKEI